MTATRWADSQSLPRDKFVDDAVLRDDGKVVVYTRGEKDGPVQGAFVLEASSGQVSSWKLDVGGRALSIVRADVGVLSDRRGGHDSLAVLDEGGIRELFPVPGYHRLAVDSLADALRRDDGTFVLLIKLAGAGGYRLRRVKSNGDMLEERRIDCGASWAAWYRASAEASLIGSSRGDMYVLWRYAGGDIPTEVSDPRAPLPDRPVCRELVPVDTSIVESPTGAVHRTTFATRWTLTKIAPDAPEDVVLTNRGDDRPMAAKVSAEGDVFTLWATPSSTWTAAVRPATVWLSQIDARLQVRTITVGAFEEDPSSWKVEGWLWGAGGDVWVAVLLRKEMAPGTCSVPGGESTWVDGEHSYTWPHFSEVRVARVPLECASPWAPARRVPAG